MHICDKTVHEATGPQHPFPSLLKRYEWPGVESLSISSLVCPQDVISLFTLIMIKMFSSKLEY